MIGQLITCTGFVKLTLGNFLRYILLTIFVRVAVMFGEIANFTAYAFAPAILVTPLGALSVLVRWV